MLRADHARLVGDGTTTGLDLTANAGATIELTSSNYATTGGTGTITPAGTAGNQTADPVFVDLSGHDLHQAVGSPTIDAGTGTPDAERRDIDFEVRAFGAGIDIGGDEYVPAPPPDSTPPAITATIIPAVPASGWHTTDVGVTWSIVDDESEVTTTEGCGPTTITADGTFLITCKAASTGGESSNSVTIKRDATAPTINGAVDPQTPSASGWYLTAPTVSFECDDAPSGMATCSEPTTLGSLATAQSVTGTATDVAGNSASTTVSGLLVDLVDPTVVCAATPTFTVGQTGSVSASVTDAHSGPAASTASAPATTTAAGSFTAAVTGSDNAGRNTTVQCPYVVQRVRTSLKVHPGISVRGFALRVHVTLSATLTRTDTGAPIAGEPVAFFVRGDYVCTAVTGPDGRAMCGGLLGFVKALLGGSYTATYDGDAQYQPSTGTGRI